MSGLLTSEYLSDERIREVARQGLTDKRIWIAADAEVVRHAAVGDGQGEGFAAG